jgi:hypothetical protein
MTRRKGPLIRDVELHGHHKLCSLSWWSFSRENAPCICRELDYDDWIAAGEREMDARRENPRKVVDDD